jgi:predicted dinucleotide-utilizing enzyme
MKIALLGTGFGQAHAAVYAQRPDVEEVIVFGRTPEKLAKMRDQFGFATSTDLDGVLSDARVDLVDICLPTRLHADIAIQAMRSGRDVLIELPLAGTVDDARRIVEVRRTARHPQERTRPAGRRTSVPRSRGSGTEALGRSGPSPKRCGFRCCAVLDGARPAPSR